MRKLLLLSAGFLLAAHTAAAQTVTVRGRGLPGLDTRLEQVLAGNQRVLSRDTFIARNDTLRGPILSLGNRLVLEGTVMGNLTMVDANVYARPSARIEGDVLNIGSGFYRSEQAVITGRLEDHPLAPYHVERAGDNLVIVGDVESRRFRPELRAPTANRVDGLLPRLGIALALPAVGGLNSELAGWGAYSFERPGGWQGRLQGGAELRFRRGFTHIAFGVDETTETYDRWIRSDLTNSLSFLFNGKDYRNYYESERQYLTVARELIRGPHAAIASLRLQREDGESLAANAPWSLLKPDSIRSNPAIDDGIITSGILGLTGEWIGLTSVINYHGAIEVAVEGAVGGEFGFNAFALNGEYAMQALANHTLELETRFQGPLPGTDLLPRQRWGILGGSGTLYTFETGQFRGDHLAFLESEYSIPIDRIRLPFIGSPALEFLHAIGMAWTRGTSRDFEQNLGVRIQFPMAHARLVVNPADIDDKKFSLGVRFPPKAYPWQKKEPSPLPLPR